MRVATLESRIGGGARVASWIAQFAVAAILAQTLFFKFTYAPETRLIFSDLGGRPAATVAGLAELACALLLLYPGTPMLGAFLTIGVMAGAIGTHLFLIGIEIVDPATGHGDGGLLFGLAVAVLALSSAVIILRRREFAAWISALRRPTLERSTS